MIRPGYAHKLARTKLRSKRGMLITSVIVSSLLFAALIACIIVFTAAQKSADSFVKAAGNDRYLVQTRPNIPTDVRYPSPLTDKDVDEIRAFEKAYYRNIQQTYTDAGIDYDPASEVTILKPNPFKTDDSPAAEQWMIDFTSPAMQEWQTARLDRYAVTAPNTYSKLQEVGSAYGATGYYTQTPTPFPPLPGSRLILNGAEDFDTKEALSSDPTPYGYLINAVRNSNYQFRDDPFVDRYLFTNDAATLRGIPVIITAQEAAMLFGSTMGLGDEPESGSAKIAWLHSIQEKLNGYTYQVCTRNSTEQEMLTKIQRDFADIEKNKDTANYQQPALQYQLPTTPCGDVTVKKDTRAQSEKDTQAKTNEALQKIGAYTPPEHHLTTFQIVGVVNAQPYSEYNMDVESYIKNLLSPQDNSHSAIIPRALYDQLPDHLRFDPTFDTDISTAQHTLDNIVFAPRILEFSSIDAARNFLNDETCPMHDLGCTRPFYGTPYGSNYLILDEIGKLFQQIITIAAPVMTGMASIIIWFTISRIMADNRKETAIYRAMGAKRIDIVAIYSIYTLQIAARIALLSFAAGIGIAYAVDRMYGTQLTDIARSAFGVTTDLHFNLFDISSPLLLAALAVIFIISLIASIQPLIRNVVMRSPIRDMREE